MNCASKNNGCLFFLSFQGKENVTHLVFGENMQSNKTMKQG